MGYRNETEQLRHRVQQLEGELEDLKGARGRGIGDHLRGRARRQTILIAVMALMASATGGLCLIPTIAATLGHSEVDSSLAEVATSPSYTYPSFTGTMDVSDPMEVGLYDWAAPIAEEPRIVVSCTWDCPRAIERELSGGDATQRTFYGEVAHLGDLEFTRIDAGAMQAHADRHGLSLDELRVVTLQRRDDPRPGLFMMLAMLLMAGLALWIALFWHLRAIKSEAPLPTGADYQTRDPGTTLILTIVTCRMYELVWIYLSTAQLRRLTGRRDLNPGLDVMLTLMTFGFWSFWVHYRNVEACDEALAERDFHVNQRGTVVGLTLGSFLCGVLHWVLLYKVQEAYNLLISERMEHDDLL